MADQKKVELILGIKTTGAVDAAAGLESISTVAASLAGELSKLERADVLKQLGATAAQVGADIGSVDIAAERLAAELKAIGATEKEIRSVSAAFDKTTVEINKAAAAQAKLAQQQDKAVIAAGKQAEKDEAALRAQTRLTEQMRLSQTGATGLQKELSKLSRESEFQKLATDAGLAAKKTGDVGKSVDDLTKKLTALGATKDEISGVAGAFNAAQSGEGGGGGAGGNALQRLGTLGRSLPSTPLPGGITSDALSNITRLAGAFAGLSEKSALATTAASLLTPALGAEAAATAAAYAPLVIFSAGLIAIGLAFKSLSDSMSQNVDTIHAYAEAQRELNQDVAKGLTSDEARKQLEENAKLREGEQKLRDQNKAAYADFETQAKAAAGEGSAFGEIIKGIGAAFGSAGAQTADAGQVAIGVAQALSGDEQEFTDQIATSDKKLADLAASDQTLNRSLEDGTFAANDAAVAEKALADERTKTALNAADVAAKELQAQQKALAATEDQNNARLTAIDNEKDVVQAQIDSLTASGVTSEEVTDKIKALNAQLGILGNESAFIKDTALAVSKQNDADKKAKKDAEDAAKKAQQAQEQYTKAIAAAGKTYTQSLQDIGTRLTQALSDNETKFNRDLTNIATKYRRDEFDLEIKAQRAERDALIDQQNDLRDIRKQANKDEQDALQEGDFRALYLSRVKRDETLEQEQETLDLSKQKRDQSFKDAQEDLLRNAQRQRQDRVMGYEQQSADIRTNQQRELAQARLTQQRALQAASEAQSAGLGQIQNYWNKFLSIQQNAMNNSLKMAAGQSGSGGQPQSPGSFTPGVFRAVAGVIRR